MNWVMEILSRTRFMKDRAVGEFSYKGKLDIINLS